MGNKYTEAQARAIKKYQDAHTSIKITLEKEQKKQYQEHAKQKGLSLTQLIVNLIEADMKGE